MLLAVASALPPGAMAEQASQPGSLAAGSIDAGGHHSCAVAGGSVRCWGYGAEGQLGYANTSTIGDDESPGSVGPVDLGAGRSASAISAGGFHTCALLDDGMVRCWGYGYNGALGYGNRNSVGDDEPPGSVVPVDLGEGRTAKAISAGYDYTCAVLDDGAVRCWGFGADGRLGYANTRTIGDDEPPSSVGPVDLGDGRAAVAISAGHFHGCALLDDKSVRCWGYGGDGRLGYADTATIGDDEPPGSVGPVDLGAGRTATAISAGRHSCALLDAGDVRCWGPGTRGQLGYANKQAIGDDETPGSVGPVNLGAGGAATAIGAGDVHACARFLSSDVRCWGYGANGRLGQCNERNIGDDEVPGAVAPVALATASCGSAASAGPPPSRASPIGSATAVVPPEVPGLTTEAARLRGLGSCHARVARHARREVRRARRGSRARRGRARRHIKRHRTQLRRRCLRRFGRTPGRVTGLRAGAISPSSILLSFRAPGTHGEHPPPARSYLVKQSRRPIRSRRAFRRARTLCKGSCRFPAVTLVGDEIRLTVTDLRPRTTYYYAVAARDNVSCRLGRRSRAVTARTPARGSPPPAAGHGHSGPGSAVGEGRDRPDPCRSRG